MYAQYFLVLIGCAALMYFLVRILIGWNPDLVQAVEHPEDGEWLPDPFYDWVTTYVAALGQISLWAVGAFAWRVFLAFGYEPDLRHKNAELFGVLNIVALVSVAIAYMVVSFQAFGGAHWETSVTAFYCTLPALFFVITSIRTARTKPGDADEFAGHINGANTA